MGLFADNPRILSFGCSTGEELVTLKHLFPRAEIVGAEVVPERIAAARMLSGCQVDTLQHIEGDFDLITAMSVLCRWPKEAGTLAYEDFESTLRELALRVRVGGVLVVYNASYDPSRILTPMNFEKLDQFNIQPPAFVEVLDGVSGDGVFRRLI